MPFPKLPQIISGDGRTSSTAVQFEACDLKTRKAAERAFISKQYGEEGFDWTSGIHITTAPFTVDTSSPLSDLFRKAYQQYAAERGEQVPEHSQDSPGESVSNSVLSLWNIDLADGTSKRVYFDTSNTIYDE